jgi:hypothetical protein
MQYTLRSLSGDQMSESLAEHVFARAYEAAWVSKYGDDPVGSHVIEGLDLVIDFTEQTSRWRH